MTPTPAPAPRTAPAADQVRLLDVQALDTRLAQLAHRARTLPVHAELGELAAGGRALRDRLVAARTALSDADREGTRAEVDVEAVRSRAQRTAERLASQGASAKDAQALARDAESLSHRLADLEDVQLEVMERQESAAGAVAELEGSLAELNARGRALTAQRDAALGEVAAEVAAVEQQRAGAASGLDAALLAFYDGLREREAGLGAAPLQGERCGGCRQQQTPSYLSTVRAAAADAVVRCEECGRILVRVPGSTQLRS